MVDTIQIWFNILLNHCDEAVTCSSALKRMEPSQSQNLSQMWTSIIERHVPDEHLHRAAYSREGLRSPERFESWLKLSGAYALVCEPEAMVRAREVFDNGALNQRTAHDIEKSMDRRGLTEGTLRDNTVKEMTMHPDRA